MSLLRNAIVTMVIAGIAVGIDYYIHMIYLEVAIFPTNLSLPVEGFEYYSVKFVVVFSSVFLLRFLLSRGIFGGVIIAGVASGVFGLYYGVTRPVIFTMASLLDGLNFTFQIGLIHFVVILVPLLILGRLLSIRKSR